MYLLTGPNDYEGVAIPPTLRLNMFTSVECLHIPTFSNDTEEEPASEAFSIVITSAVAQSLIPVRTTSNSILVTVFEQCRDGDIRLSEGNSVLQGRVQMCYDGVFGSVCDTGVWTMQDATVVCTQLGYPILLPGTCHAVIRTSVTHSTYILMIWRVHSRHTSVTHSNYILTSNMLV